MQVQMQVQTQVQMQTQVQTQMQWKDLFNQKPQLKLNLIEPEKSVHDLLIDHLKSSNSLIYVREPIPQSIIKKSRKDARAYKKSI